MSTATRIPTPAEVFDRELVALYVRPDGAEPFRGLYERGIRGSRMLPTSRLVALTVLGYADATTGVIADGNQPDVRALSKATGLGAEQVRVHLAFLSDRGWITRERAVDGKDPDLRPMQPCIRRHELDRLLAP